MKTITGSCLIGAVEATVKSFSSVEAAFCRGDDVCSTSDDRTTQADGRDLRCFAKAFKGPQAGIWTHFTEAVGDSEPVGLTPRGSARRRQFHREVVVNKVAPNAVSSYSKRGGISL